MSERIVFENQDGTVGVICPAPGINIKDCQKDVPAAALQSEVVATADVSSDRVFRNAWVFDSTSPGKCRESVTKSKLICHDKRRAKRNAEFAPLDIKATIPSEAAVAEDARIVIRAKHDQIQLDVDACTTTEELKIILLKEGL